MIIFKIIFFVCINNNLIFNFQTISAKVNSQEGNSPDYKLRFLIININKLLNKYIKKR